MEGELLNAISSSSPDLSLGAMTVAVTGASGFVGARVTEMLAALDLPPRIRPLSRRVSKDRPYTIVDLRDPLSVMNALKGCRAVIHCAFDFMDLASNLHIASVLGNVCAAIGARLVHVSTATIHEPFSDGELDETREPPKGGSDYKQVKLAIEDLLLRMVRDQRLDLVILQPNIVYGPFGRAWTDSPIRELLTGTVVLPNEGRGLCNAVFVDDVCQAIIAALTAPLPSGERILVSGPHPVTWRDFYRSYENILGVRALRLQSADGRWWPVGLADLGQNRWLTGSLEDMTAEQHDEPLPGSASPHGGKRLRRIARKTLGSRATTRLNMWLSYLRSILMGRTVHLPTDGKLALFSARCHIRIDKAKRLLSYEPLFDLEAGMRATTPYVLRTYGRFAGLKTHCNEAHQTIAIALAPEPSKIIRG
jgi:nucleoside-diphosphate-sugar epimerase